MMFPRSFRNLGDPVVVSDPSLYDDRALPELSTPGKIYRDALAFGIKPSGVSGCLYDDDDCDRLDAACDLSVQKTDLIDKSFYRDNPEYQTPSSLRRQDLASTSPSPATSPAGNDTGNSDSVETSTSPVE